MSELIPKKPFYEHNVRDIIQQWQTTDEDGISFSRMVELLNETAFKFIDDNKKIKVKKVKSVTCYTACIDIYNNFILKHTGLPGKFDGAEGKAMKSIISYLESVTHIKTDDGTINSFNHILNLYDKWDPFHKNQLKLSQINSNLINIINSIKNGTSKKSTGQYEQSKYNNNNPQSAMSKSV